MKGSVEKRGCKNWGKEGGEQERRGNKFASLQKERKTLKGLIRATRARIEKKYRDSGKKADIP